MCWIILNWDTPEVVTVVSNYVGMPQLFDTKEEAEEYAKEHLNFNWKSEICMSSDSGDD